jgi:hypothetical protein
VEADVLGRGTQYVGMVLELPQPAVAVEAQQRSDGTRGVVVINMRRWGRPTDRA